MRLLLDTHVLLWAAGEPDRLSAEASSLIAAEENALYFSAASLWEIAIKRGLGREDFQVQPRALRRGLLENGYEELPILGEHALAVEALAGLHKDPFDRLLLAQAITEGLALLSADRRLQAYGAPVRPA